jgi:chromosome segregation ATPase
MMVDALASTGRQLAADMETLSRSVLDISGRITAVAAKLERLQTPDGVIEVRLDPAIQSLTGAVDRFSVQSDRNAVALKDAVEAAKGVAEGSSTSMVSLRDHVDTNSVASQAALEAARASSDAIRQMLDQFKGNAWEQIDVLRSVLERTDHALRTFTEAVVKSGADMEAQTQGFHDILVTIQRSVDTLAIATERLADLAEDVGARRMAPVREAIR